MLHAISFTIDASDLPHRRLDTIILARHPTSTRAFVRDAIVNGSARVDGIPRPKAFTPSCGAVITLPCLLERADRTVQPGAGDLTIVWSDDDLIAVDKPGGQPCHPVAPGETGTLANRLVAHDPGLAQIGDAPMMAGLLHRIDAGTSGLVLVARTQAAFTAVRNQFADRTVKKVYTAIVQGTIRKNGGISGHLAHCSSFRGRMRVVAGGTLPRGERALFAETFYRPLGVKHGQTRLEITIQTGVTHQIRCQLASIGHPIVGDSLYGTDRPRTGPFGDHHLLHATSVTLLHPRTGADLFITCPPPDPFA